MLDLDKPIFPYNAETQVSILILAVTEKNLPLVRYLLDRNAKACEYDPASQETMICSYAELLTQLKEEYDLNDPDCTEIIELLEIKSKPEDQCSPDDEDTTEEVLSSHASQPS